MSRIIRIAMCAFMALAVNISASAQTQTCCKKQQQCAKPAATCCKKDSTCRKAEWKSSCDRRRGNLKAAKDSCCIRNSVKLQKK